MVEPRYRAQRGQRGDHPVWQGEAGTVPHDAERQFGAQLGVIRHEVRPCLGAEQPVAQVPAVAAQILTASHWRAYSSNR
jgi:hypothetical protein